MVLSLLLLSSLVAPQGDYNTNFSSNSSGDFNSYVQIGNRGLTSPNSHSSIDWSGDLSLHARYANIIGVALKRGGPQNDGVFTNVVSTLEYRYENSDPQTSPVGLALRQRANVGINTYPLYHVVFETGVLEIRSWRDYSVQQVLASEPVPWTQSNADFRIVASALTRGGSSVVDLMAAVYQNGVLLKQLYASEVQIAPAGSIAFYSGEAPGNSDQWRGINVTQFSARDPFYRTDFSANVAGDFEPYDLIASGYQSGSHPDNVFDWSNGLILGGSNGHRAGLRLDKGGMLDNGVFRSFEVDFRYQYERGKATNEDVGVALVPNLDQGGSERPVYFIALVQDRFEIGRWNKLGNGSGVFEYRTLEFVSATIPNFQGEFRIQVAVHDGQQPGDFIIKAAAFRNSDLLSSLTWEGTASLEESMVGFVAGANSDTDPIARTIRALEFQVGPVSGQPNTAPVGIESSNYISVELLQRADGNQNIDLNDAVFKNAANYWIFSHDDPNYSPARNPIRVGRRSEQRTSYPWVGGIPWDADVAHIAYMEVPYSLKPGHQYSVRVTQVVSEGEIESTFKFGEDAYLNTNIKVNQVGFLESVGPKMAYIGAYMGDLGPLPATELQGRPFQVRKAQSGDVVFTGQLQLRKMATEVDDLNRNFSGEDLFEADFSSLTAAGEYVVSIPNLGRSHVFRIDDDVYDNVYRTAARGLYHQRFGLALDPQFTNFPRGAVPATGSQPTNVNNRDCDDCFDRITSSANWQSGSIQTFEGGWWDAGDWDSRYQHFTVVYLLTDLYEQFPSAIQDNELGLPESGNATPDVLDEAWFGLKLYYGMQQEDKVAGRGAGIRGGVNIDKNAPWQLPETYTGPWYAYAQSATTSFEYAAVAAKLAMNLQSFQPGLAANLLMSAQEAYQWAVANQSGARDAVYLARASAAVEIYRATQGESYWHDEFLAAYPLKEINYNWQFRHLAWSYFHADNLQRDAAIVQEVTDYLLGWAQEMKDRQDLQGYRNSRVRTFAVAWHETGTSLHQAVDLIRGWLIQPGRTDWLDAALHQVNFQLGANPLNISWITGVGDHYPMRPLHLQSYADAIEEPVPGISIFGTAFGSFGNSKEVQENFYPDDSVYPPFRMFTDSNEGAVMHAEFTVHENLGWNVFVYGFLKALH